LEGAVNRPTDVNRSKDNFDAEIVHPAVSSGERTEDSVIEDLFAAEENFDDDSLDYELIPKPKSDGYNSNSFAAGILEAVGFVNIPSPPHVAPGFDKPVPPEEFDEDPEQ